MISSTYLFHSSPAPHVPDYTEQISAGTVRTFWLYRSDQKFYCELSNWGRSAKSCRFEQTMESVGLNEIWTLYRERVGSYFSNFLYAGERKRGPFCYITGQSTYTRPNLMLCRRLNHIQAGAVNPDKFSSGHSTIFISLMEEQFVVTHRYSVLLQRENVWQILNP